MKNHVCLISEFSFEISCFNFQDLKHRRKEEEFIEAAQTEFYIDRASTLMDSIESVSLIFCLKKKHQPVIKFFDIFAETLGKYSVTHNFL